MSLQYTGMTCDHCRTDLWPDKNGHLLDIHNSTHCPDSEHGHEYEGSDRV